MNPLYLCICIPHFYASVECIERGLDFYQCDLAIIDTERGKASLCLDMTPSMKEKGLFDRCRLYDIPVDLNYIKAKPRMSLYKDYSISLYELYLHYISKDDIHIYALNEVFIDITHYLSLYQMKAYDLALMILEDIKKTFQLDAYIGIGTNMYLAKIAADLLSNHHSPISSLNENMYKKYLWTYQPLNHFWHIGESSVKRLEKLNLFTMKDISQCSFDLLYSEFKEDAYILKDHSLGIEPTTILDIKNYKPKSQSMSHSIVLCENYTYEQGLNVLKEIVELKVLDLVKKHLATQSISIKIYRTYNDQHPIYISQSLNICTNSIKILLNEFVQLYKQVVSLNDTIRKLTIHFYKLIDEINEYYDLFTDYEDLEKEKQLQLAILNIKDKYGKNAIMKGMNTFETSTTKRRNKYLGGHNEE